MPSNLAAIIEGVVEQLRTIGVFKNVLTYKPDKPDPLPMMYLGSIHVDYPETTYGEMTLGWTFDWYLVPAPIAANPKAAEARIYTLVPEVIEALGHDLDAHGALAGLSDGQVLLTNVDEGDVTIGGSKWYVVRLRMRAIERFTYQYSL